MSTDFPDEPKGVAPFSAGRVTSILTRVQAAIERGAHTESFPTILGPDASFKGELTFENGMRLHGKFEGRLKTPGRLHIAKEARMLADVDAGAITVEGDVHGNLNAGDRIELTQTARYEGDLRASRLVVDEGAIMVGHVTVGPDAVKNSHAYPAPSRPAALHVSTPQTEVVK